MHNTHVIQTYEGQQSTVWGLDWSPDGRYLASASEDGSVHVWEVSSGTSLFVYSNYLIRGMAVAWSRDGTGLASAGPHEMLGGNEVDIWNVFTGTRLHSYDPEVSGEIASLAWSPDGRTLAFGVWDGTVHVWDTTTERGTCIYTYDTNPGFVYSLSWSPEGDALLSTSDEGYVLIHHAPAWTTRRLPLAYHQGVFAGAWSPQTSAIAVSVGHDVHILNSTDGASLCVCQGHSSYVQVLSWSSDGRFLASGAIDKTVRLWDATTGQCLHSYEGFVGQLHGLCWSPDGTALAFAGQDGIVSIYAVDFL